MFFSHFLQYIRKIFTILNIEMFHDDLWDISPLVYCRYRTLSILHLVSPNPADIDRLVARLFSLSPNIHTRDISRWRMESLILIGYSLSMCSCSFRMIFKHVLKIHDVSITFSYLLLKLYSLFHPLRWLMSLKSFFVW